MLKKFVEITKKYTLTCKLFTVVLLKLDYTLPGLKHLNLV